MLDAQESKGCWGAAQQLPTCGVHVQLWCLREMETRFKLIFIDSS